MSMNPLTLTYLHKAVNDPELRSLNETHTDDCLGFPNIRRAAQRRRLKRVGDSEKALAEHLGSCAYCQRHVTLYQATMEEVPS